MTTAATTADLDGDGHLDLIFANYFRDGSDLYNPEGAGVVELPESFSHAANGGGERIFRWAGAAHGEEIQAEEDRGEEAVNVAVEVAGIQCPGAADQDRGPCHAENEPEHDVARDPFP